MALNPTSLNLLILIIHLIFKKHFLHALFTLPTSDSSVTSFPILILMHFSLLFPAWLSGSGLQFKNSEKKQWDSKHPNHIPLLRGKTYNIVLSLIKMFALDIFWILCIRSHLFQIYFVVVVKITNRFLILAHILSDFIVLWFSLVIC